MKVLVIIPAYNEAQNICRVVDGLQLSGNNGHQYDYVIVNDGSRDETAVICHEHGYNLINLPVNLGLTGAVQTGMLYAMRNGYDMAIQFDGDGQHDPACIAPMVEQMLRNDDDIVIGSRFVNEKKPRSLRMLGNNIIEWAIHLTTGTDIRDTTSGMRLYNRRMIEAYAGNINMSPEPDTVSYLLRCGAKVSEVQVQMHERIAGTSYLNLSRSIQYMFKMCMSIVFIQWFRQRRL